MTQIECPICGLSFSKDKIEKHADTCLRFPKEKATTRRRSSGALPASAPKSSPAPKSVGSFFTKQNKRKSSRSPEAKAKKKCGENSTENNNSIIISESPPLPSVDVRPDENKDQVDKRMNGFQETLLKWSKESKEIKVENGRTTSDQTDEDLKPIETDCKVVVDNHINGGTTTSSKLETKKKLKPKKTEIILGKIPLADQMRPTNFDTYFGQEAVNSNKVLKELFYNKRIPSLLLWGPPGCGKVRVVNSFRN